MNKHEKSLKYVPTYQVVEQIRKEEKQIAKDKIKMANDIAKTEREEKESILMSAIGFLHEKQMTSAEIAKILNVSTQKVVSVVRKLKDS